MKIKWGRLMKAARNAVRLAKMRTNLVPGRSSALWEGRLIGAKDKLALVQMLARAHYDVPREQDSAFRVAFYVTHSEDDMRRMIGYSSYKDGDFFSRNVRSSRPPLGADEKDRAQKDREIYIKYGRPGESVDLSGIPHDDYCAIQRHKIRIVELSGGEW